MTTPFLDLLKQIASGVTIYEPFRRTPHDLKEFEDTVDRLKEMERLGLIRRLFTHTPTDSDGEYIDLAMVQGGLTPEGQRLLEEALGLETPSTPKK